MSRFAFVIFAIVALVASSCARSETLGPEEAIEVMVLDGVNRGRATCIVRNLGGQIELAKVTGLEVDLTDHELVLLSTTSAGCAPVVGTGGGIVGGFRLDEEDVAAQFAAENTAADIENYVFALVDDGLESSLTNCLIARLNAVDDAQEIADDDFAIAAVVVDCRDQVDAADS